MFADKVLFLAEKLKAIPMFSELFIYKINHNDLATLQMLIQPLVYQVQYFFLCLTETYQFDSVNT